MVVFAIAIVVVVVVVLVFHGASGRIIIGRGRRQLSPTDWPMLGQPLARFTGRHNLVVVPVFENQTNCSTSRKATSYLLLDPHVVQYACQCVSKWTRLVPRAHTQGFGLCESRSPVKLRVLNQLLFNSRSCTFLRRLLRCTVWSLLLMAM